MTKELFHLRQFRLLLLVLLCTLFSLPLSAQEAYVRQSEDQHTLTFYYDNNRKGRSGETWGINEKSSSSTPVWAGTYEHPNGVVIKVVFDDSFKNYRPITTNRWFYNLKALTTIKGLENLNTSEVTNMSDMFYGCSNLTFRNLSNFNTSEVTDMREMFSGCSGLWSLNLSNFNTSKVTDMREMFSRCSGLWSLNLSNFNTSKVTDMGLMFNDCSNLEELNVSNFNTSKVTDMDGMFSGCSRLTELNLSNFNTSAVTNMSRMFLGCSGLTSLSLSNFNTSKVTDMSFIFNGCSRLTELNVSNFNTSKVTNMGSMFDGCSGLTSLNVSYFNTSAVSDMSEMFSGCSGLKYLNVSYFNTSAVSDMSGMFKDCSSLKYINVSNFNIARVNNTSEMFRNCSNLKTIYNASTWQSEKFLDMFEGCTQLKGAVKYNDADWGMWMANPNTGYFTHPDKKMSEAYVVQSEDKKSLIFFYDKLSDTRSGKTWDIDEKLSDSKPVWAGTDYSSNKVVTKVEFDTSFKNFRPTTTNSWFFNLEALTTIEGLENLNTSAVTNMSAMFSGRSSLKELNVSNFNTSKVTDMSEMFRYCSSLKGLNVSNFNTSVVTDMSNMFSGCSSLKRIFNTQTWRCEKSQGMFEDCTQLRGAVKYHYLGSKNEITMANPTTGYFTDPNRKEAYVQQSEDKHTLTFFYDTYQTLRSGKTWDIDEKEYINVNIYVKDREREEFPTWTRINNYPNKLINKVVFDASFKDFRPTTTKGWFYRLSGLTTIEGLENLNTSAATDMSWMFYDCSSLTSLNVSNFNTSAVTDMSYMFYDCSGLMSLNVSSFNTSKVTDMSYMFYHCSGLTSLNVSSFNTSAVTDMNGMFAGCSSLTELNVSNFDTYEMINMRTRDMRRMFAACSRLKTILNPYTWQGDVSYEMFYGCTSLIGAVKFDANKSDVTMANPTTGYFTDPKRKLEAYVLQSEDQHTLTFYYDYNRKLRSGKTWDIYEKSSSSEPFWAGRFESPNNVVTRVVFDASFKDFRPTTTKLWFYNLKALTIIEGFQNLNTSAVTDMSSMFYGCSSLTELNVSNFNTSTVTDMDAMFYGCSGLTSLNVSNFNTSAVTDMSTMFYACSRLTELNVSNFNTSKVTDMLYMFEGCSGLTELNLSSFNTEAVTDMFGMFYGCSGLKELNVSNFNTSAVTDMRRMFWNCSGLKELNVSNFNTSAVTGMSNMFYGCSGLTSLNLSNFNTSAVTSMGYMFYGCSVLASLNLSNFNTSAVTDVSWMFSGCSGLKTILNPNTWRCELSDGMFYGCTQLNGAVKYDESKVDATMANPTTGYFSQKLPSAIGRVVFDDNNTTQIYNLQGKRVNANQRHLPAGFYIVNGKKVYLNEKP